MRRLRSPAHRSSTSGCPRARARAEHALRAWLERSDMAEVDAFALIERPSTKDADVAPRPDARAELDRHATQFLGELSPSGVVFGLAGFHSPAGRAPPRPVVIPEADQQHAVRFIEQQDADSLSARHR